MDRHLLKASIFMTYFFLFLGSLLVGLVLVYMFLYSGIGIVKLLIYYDSKAMAEEIGGLISASASYDGNISHSFALPRVNCTIDINSLRLQITLPENKISRDGRDLTIESSNYQIPLIRPDNLVVSPTTVQCSDVTEIPFHSLKEEQNLRFTT